MTDFGDPWINFFARQLAAFAGLRALRHFDLQLFCFDQIKACDPEAARSDLFNCAILGVAILHWDVAFRVFAAFTGVAFATNAVHGYGQSFMRFFADGAVAHRAGFKPLHDTLDRFNFLDRHGFYFLEIEQTAQSTPVLLLFVHQRRIFFEDFGIARPDGLLKFVNGLRIEKVILATVAPLILSAHLEDMPVYGPIRKGALMS